MRIEHEPDSQGIRVCREFLETQYRFLAIIGYHPAPQSGPFRECASAGAKESTSTHSPRQITRIASEHRVIAISIDHVHLSHQVHRG